MFLMLYLIDNLIELVRKTQEVRYILMVGSSSYIKPLNILKEIIKLWLVPFLLQVKITGNV